MESFIGPYRVKKIVLSNIVELEFQYSKNTSSSKCQQDMKIYRTSTGIKKQPALVIIEGKEEWEVKKILNKQWIRENDKYLVRQKGFTVESDTWEGKENLENIKEVIEEFEKEYQQDIEDIRR